MQKLPGRIRGAPASHKKPPAVLDLERSAPAAAYGVVAEERSHSLLIWEARLNIAIMSCNPKSSCSETVAARAGSRCPVKGVRWNAVAVDRQLNSRKNRSVATGF